MDNLLILSNSPGEITGWVKPAAEAFAKTSLPVRVTLAALPCQYASGRETDCAAAMAGIGRAVRFRDVWREGASGGKTLILQLGGDPMFGAMLKIKMHGSWMIYSARPRWRSLVNYYFVPDEKSAVRFQAAGIRQNRYETVGNLILDSVPDCGSAEEARAKFGLAGDEFAVSFLAGSRPFEYSRGFPLFIKAALLLMERFPQCRVFLPVASTVDAELVCRALAAAGLVWTGGARPKEIVCGKAGGIRFIRENTLTAVKASRLAVALPGTNNLQIAALGVPLLMLAPLNEAEHIPLDGLAGSLPMTPAMKRKLVNWYNRREKYLSLPNRLTNRDIVPEHRRIMTHETVAELTSELLASPDRLADIAEGYKHVPLAKGASAKIAARAAEFFTL